MEGKYLSASCGSSHTAVILRKTRSVVTWGRGEDGQLGHGDAESQNVPLVVAALENKDCDEVVCGAEYSIAVSRSTQKIWSWGWGDFGRLGHGDPNDLFIPKQVSSLCNVKIKLVACGDSHTMVITGEGDVFSFGRNQNGQLGLGSRIDCMVPKLVSDLKGQPVESIACGAEHTVACTAAGKTFAWGWGLYGNLGHGDNKDRLSPTEVKWLTDSGVFIKTVACGWRHSCAVTDNGELYTFGWSKYGQLGHGDNEISDKPKVVAALKGRVVVAVSGGWRHTMASDSEGNVYACGWNQYGQVGNGNNEDVNTMSIIKALQGERVALIRCGWRHSVAITESDKLYSWGRGVHGQLGHPQKKDFNLPTLLTGLEGGEKEVLGGHQLPAKVPQSTIEDVSISAAARYATVPDSSGAPAQGGGPTKKLKT